MLGRTFDPTKSNNENGEKDGEDNDYDSQNEDGSEQDASVSSAKNICS